MDDSYECSNEERGRYALVKGLKTQMSKIGTGQAGGNWTVIEGLIRERLVSEGFEVYSSCRPDEREQIG